MEVRKLDEATRKALLGYVPFSPNSTISFTPKQWPKVNAEFTPSFDIRSFTQGEITQLRTNYKSLTDTNVSEVSEKNTEILRRCVKGWSRLFDAGTCEEVKYQSDPEGGCDKESWDKIPTWIISEILDEVRKISGLVPIEDLGLKSSPVSVQDSSASHANDVQNRPSQKSN